MADLKISEFEDSLAVNGEELLTGLQDGDNINFPLSLLKTFIKGYKEYSGRLTFAGAVITVVPLINDFPTVAFTPTNPANGRFTFTADSAVFTANKTFLPGSSHNEAGTRYFVTGSAFSTTVVNINFTLYDNTQSSTPNVTDYLFEIRVYN